MTTDLNTMLQQTWVRVVDARGRAHLEARWVAAGESPAGAPTAPMHAA
ncbi:hypothetical protein [Nocardioides panaciterrulae]|uniref:Uncharacterized protein n=1 Tax=Nocardioides panaciterrulae TaxID=661492 RepID=A0A7Y9E2K3_9ACTN|nr:hypothetical protein [Nocardioides panaciterrulae]NYD40099.1 hypothetical protein [Nocardioides panaciterrulae]